MPQPKRQKPSHADAFLSSLLDAPSNKNDAEMLNEDTEKQTEGTSALWHINANFFFWPMSLSRIA